MVNVSISANTNFGVPADKFGLYAATSCQLMISVDGTNFTNYGDAFTGTKFFCHNPRNCYFKCSVDVKLTY